MPVTKTAKRALRSSKRKAEINNRIISQLEIATRMAKKDKNKSSVIAATKLVDRAAKKNVIHKNKAARMKSMLAKLIAVNSVGKNRSKKVSKRS